MSVTAAPRSMATSKTDGGKTGTTSRASPRLATPFGAPVQTKLKLGPATDHFERQADSAAAHVMGGRSGAPMLSALPMGGGTAQRACAACGDKEKKSGRIQRKCACGAAPGEACSCDHSKPEDEHPELQIDRARKHDERADGAIGAVQSVVSSGGKPLPGSVRRDMETGFGRDFGHVRIHDTPRAAASAEGIGAHAYTVGNHIAFNRGQYQPHTDSGRFLLAHELAHTVQQAGAPAARPHSISQPGDTHETQANRAAHAVTKGAPMPGLSAGGAGISRYSWSEFGNDLLDVGEAVVDAPGNLYDGAVDAVDSLIDFGSEVYQTAVAIADQLGVHVRIDGTTLVIAFDEFDPCSLADLSLDFRLSDIGLDPTLYFPLGPPLPFFTVGVFTLAGMAGVSLNLDPGMGINLEKCSFGPGEIRINALSASASISGQISVTTAMMQQLGADLSLRLDTIGIIAWPDPPIILEVPVIGVEFGGAMEFMMQSSSDYTAKYSGSVSLGGASSSFSLDNDVGFAIDLSYGLFGAVSILGQDVCRLGWPLDSWHGEMAANIQIAAAASLSGSGLSFSFSASATPLGTNPLDDLGFAFDESRMEDDCWLCEFLIENKALPSQNGYNWAGNVGNYPLLGGPEGDIYQRDPSITSGAICRGTCGLDCAPSSCDGDRQDLVVCENSGDGHIWHTYVGYETCGSHQGCRDHDACYDMMADSIWGFGGFLIGPGYRACDFDAVCNHGFQSSVQWALGGGDQPDRLRYADYAYSTPGCHGPCPVATTSEEGETEYERTCLENTPLEIWRGMQRSRHWTRELADEQIVQGFVSLPYIVGVNYGVNALAQFDADVSAKLGPFTLDEACLLYDPATETYAGTATLNLHANASASASITGALEGFLSDFLCLLNWITIRGSVTGGLTAQVPTVLSGTVDLFCQNGELTILPSARFKSCVQLWGYLGAGVEFFFLGMKLWGQDWDLANEKLAERCWDIEYTFEPFVMGEMPKFHVAHTLGITLATILDDMFDTATVDDIPHAPPRNPLRGIRVLFPCLDRDDDDDENDDERDCPRLASADDARRILNGNIPEPQWPQATRTITIPGHSGRSAQVGVEMVAEFLAHPVTPAGSETAGHVQRGIYRHPGLPTQGCFQSSTHPQRFVKGHLLNAKIGGPGGTNAAVKNLFPITEQANKDHEHDVERGGLNVVNRVIAQSGHHHPSGDLMYYHVKVENIVGPTPIAVPPGGPTGFFEIKADFVCEATDYNYCTDGTTETLEPNPIGTPVRIRSRFQYNGNAPFDQIADPTRCPS